MEKTNKMYQMHNVIKSMMKKSIGTIKNECVDTCTKEQDVKEIWLKYIKNFHSDNGRSEHRVNAGICVRGQH